MALQKTLNFRGIEVKDSYCKVINISGSKEKLYFSVGSFIQGNKEPFDIAHFEIIPKLEGVNFIKQAYEHLKTLDDFKDSIDA